MNVQRHVVAAVCCTGYLLLPALSACSSRTGEAPASKVEFVVDDNDATGVIGDNHLSLAEAIRVANGELAATELSDDERSRTPGHFAPGTSARIRVSVGRGAVISVNTTLPILRDLAGVTIDGGGAVLKAGGDQVDGGAFTIASSRFTLNDFAFEGFGTAVSITPQGVRDLHDIALARLTVVTNSIGIAVLGRNASGSLGSLRNVTISESDFSGIPGPYGNALNGIRIEGMTQAGTEVDDPVIDGITITGNRFKSGLLEGVDIAGYTGLGSTSSPPPSTGGGVLRNVTITQNTFEDCPDACVLGIAALGIGSTLSNLTISGLRIVDNDMTNGTGVYLVAGYALGGGTTQDNLFSNVEISGNRLRASEGRACGGFALVADYTDLSNGLGTGDRIEDAAITGNEVIGCHRGVLVAGAGSSGTLASLMTDNSVAGVQIVDNRIADTALGIHVSGADVIDGRLLGNSPLTGNPGFAVMTGNEVSDVVIDGNEVSGGTLGLLISGGSVRDANANTVTANAVRGVQITGNELVDNQADCLVTNDYVHGSTAAVVLGNSVEDASCP